MDYTTLQELYLRSIERFADRPCSSMYGGETLTYAQFAKRVDKVAGILRSGGLVPGDKVALLSNNMPNWAVCYFATVCSGMVIVPILPDFSPAELERIIEHCDAKALFVSDKLFSKISRKTVAGINMVVRTMNLGIISHRSLKRNAEGLKQALAASPGGREESVPAPEERRDGEQAADDTRQETAKKPSLRELIEAATAGPTNPDGTSVRKMLYAPQPDDPAAIIYTSGTTSEPKGVVLSHGNLASQIVMDDNLFPIMQDDVFLSILPLSHTYECSLGMLLPFAAGAQVVYLDKLPTPSTLMPALRQIRPTVVLSVPLIIEKIYRNQIASRFSGNRILSRIYSFKWFRKYIHRKAGKRLFNIFGGRLRFFGIGGAKLDAETERFLMEGHFPYAVGYGLTETAPLLAGAIPGKVRFRSTGPMLRDVQVRLDNIDPETGDGELVVLSPSTMQGYYDNPEATAAVFTEDGWLRTGDIGHFDSHGNLYIVGRVDNMIVGAGGENIYPEEIESVINSHFLVTDSIVKREQGKLIALVRFDKEITGGPNNLRERINRLKEEIKQDVNSKVSRASQISDVQEQETEFEKTPTHKIKRFKYKEEEGDGQTPSGEESGDEGNTR